MQLAEQTKCENNIVHRDVVDAMIRQPFSKDAIPFKANKISNGTVMYAVDYDLGVNGAAYYDLDTANYRISTGRESMGNRGRTYRNDGVDIYEDSIHHGDWYIGHTEDGGVWLCSIRSMYWKKASITWKLPYLKGMMAAFYLSAMKVPVRNNRRCTIPSTAVDLKWSGNHCAKNFALRKKESIICGSGLIKGDLT